jgi:glyoxylate reductase
MIQKPRVFVTRMIPEKGLTKVMGACEAVIWPEDFPPSRTSLIENIHNVEGILCLITDTIDAEVMDAAGPSLKIISNYAVGFDNIDIESATHRGVLVGNTPDVVTDATADLAFTLLMAAARRIGEGIDYIRAGKWNTFKPMELLGKDIHGATLGIIGMGRIGVEMARRAAGFSMNIIYYDHRMRPEKGRAVGARMCTSLDELLLNADFLSLHVPLSPKTKHLIDAGALKKMKNTAVLINTSRGPIVECDALYEALRSGDIAYAALDVTDPEPLPADHKLLGLSNCLIVPHIGSSTVMTRNRMAGMAAENLIAGVSGRRPDHLVNPEALPHHREKS